ncbi:hypothetical protein KJ975_00610 [Myxococcota bacterium]|nr:hypothetical protein [Myxococcota bacterium]
MTPFDAEDRTEPVRQLSPQELVAGEISLRSWPVRLGPLALDRIRDLEEERIRLDEEWTRLDFAREQARSEGFRQGQEEANSLNLKRFSDQLRRHDDALASLKGQLMSRVPQLAAKLAARALGRELAATQEALTVWVSRMLANLMPAEDVTLFHHPDDAGRFGGLLHRIAPSYQHVRFQLREDERVAPGEVILETPGLRIDARSSSLAAAWERELEQVLHESDPG